MAAELILSPEVENDLAEAYGWYEGRREGLGEDFLSRVDACIQSILRTPKMHSVLYGGCRRGLVRRFPYAVFYNYSVDADTVTVYAVFHTSQNPQKWRQRLS